MGFLDSFFKKKKPILNQDDYEELKEIERKAYLLEAKNLVEQRGKEKAKNDIIVKPIKNDKWEIK